MDQSKIEEKFEGLTATERKIFLLVAKAYPEELIISKDAIAAAVGRGRKTVDRSIRRMKADGWVAVTPHHAEDCGQLSNGYLALVPCAVPTSRAVAFIRRNYDI